MSGTATVSAEHGDQRPGSPIGDRVVLAALEEFAGSLPVEDLMGNPEPCVLNLPTFDSYCTY